MASNTLRRQGVSYMIPAQPGRPAVPGYWEEDVSWESIPIYGTRETTVYLPVSTGGNATGGSSTNQGGGTAMEPTTVRERVIIGYRRGEKIVRRYWIEGRPAVPAQPAMRLAAPGNAWDGNAYSLHHVYVGGGAKFSVKQPVSGAVVGVTDEPNNSGLGYGHIKHGFAFIGNTARTVPDLTPLGSYSADDVWEIQTLQTGVTYLRNGAVVHTENMPMAKGEAVYLAAVLQGGGDAVFDPALIPGTAMDSAAVMRGVNAASSDTGAVQSFARIPFTARSSNTNYSRAVMRGVNAFSGHSKATNSLAVIPGLRAQSMGGFLAPVALTDSAAIIPGVGASSVASPFVFGAESEAVMRGVQALSGDSYSSSFARIPLSASAWPRPAGTALHIDRLLVHTAMFPRLRVRAQHIERIEIRDTATASLRFLAKHADAIGLSYAMQPLARLRARHEDRFAINVMMRPLGQYGTGDTWVATPGDEWASTTYSNFAFNSYAQIGGAYFGARDDGLYLLDGDTDNGQPIDAFIDLGAVDFRSRERKTVANAYLGMRGQAPLHLTVTADGKTYTYPTRGYGPHMRQERVDLGRGLQMNYVGIKIANQNGADFDVDTLEFLLADSKRRI